MTMPPLARRIYEWLAAGPRGWPDLRTAFADSSSVVLEAALKYLRDTGVMIYRTDQRGMNCFSRADYREPDPTESKVCTRCEDTKPIAAFSVDRNRRDGYSPYCRSCQGALRAQRCLRKKLRIRELESTHG